MGGRLILFTWRFGMKKGCGGAGSCALHVVVNDGLGSCVWQLMNQGSFGGRKGGRSVVRLYFQHLFSFVFFVCSFFYLLLLLLHKLSLLLFSCFPLFTPSDSFSNQAVLAERLFVMQSSAGRRAVCSARGGLSRDCYAGTLYPSNEGNPLVFWWIAVTLLWPGRCVFSASGLSTFKKIALTSAPDCIMTFLYLSNGGLNWTVCRYLLFGFILNRRDFDHDFLRFQAETNQFPTEQILNQCPQAKFTQSHMCCSISGTVPLVGYHAPSKKTLWVFV